MQHSIARDRLLRTAMTLCVISTAVGKNEADSADLYLSTYFSLTMLAYFFRSRLASFHVACNPSAGLSQYFFLANPSLQ